MDSEFRHNNNNSEYTINTNPNIITPSSSNYTHSQLTMMTLKQRHAYQYNPLINNPNHLYHHHQKRYSVPLPYDIINNQARYRSSAGEGRGGTAYKPYNKNHLSQYEKSLSNEYLPRTVRTGMTTMKMMMNPPINTLQQQERDQPKTQAIPFSSKLANYAIWLKDKVTSIFRVDPTYMSSTATTATIDLINDTKGLEFAAKSLDNNITKLNFNSISNKIQDVIASRNDIFDYSLSKYKPQSQDELSNSININENINRMPSRIQDHIDIVQNSVQGNIPRKPTQNLVDSRITPKTFSHINASIQGNQRHRSSRKHKHEKASLRRILNFYEILAAVRKNKLSQKNQIFQANQKPGLPNQKPLKPKPIKSLGHPLFQFVWSTVNKRYEYMSLYMNKHRNRSLFEKEDLLGKNKGIRTEEIEGKRDRFERLKQKKLRMNHDMNYHNEKTVYIKFHGHERIKIQQGRVCSTKSSNLFIHEQKEEEKNKAEDEDKDEEEEDQEVRERIGKFHEEENSLSSSSSLSNGMNSLGKPGDKPILKASKIKVDTRRNKVIGPRECKEMSHDPNSQKIKEFSSKELNKKIMKNAYSQTSRSVSTSSSHSPSRTPIQSEGNAKKFTSPKTNVSLTSPKITFKIISRKTSPKQFLIHDESDPLDVTFHKEELSPIDFLDKKDHLIEKTEESAHWAVNEGLSKSNKTQENDAQNQNCELKASNHQPGPLGLSIEGKIQASQFYSHQNSVTHEPSLSGHKLELNLPIVNLKDQDPSKESSASSPKLQEGTNAKTHHSQDYKLMGSINNFTVIKPNESITKESNVFIKSSDPNSLNYSAANAPKNLSQPLMRKESHDAIINPFLQKDNQSRLTLADVIAKHNMSNNTSTHLKIPQTPVSGNNFVPNPSPSPFFFPNYHVDSEPKPCSVQETLTHNDNFSKAIDHTKGENRSIPPIMHSFLMKNPISINNSDNNMTFRNVNPEDMEIDFSKPPEPSPTQASPNPRNHQISSFSPMPNMIRHDNLNHSIDHHLHTKTNANITQDYPNPKANNIPNTIMKNNTDIPAINSFLEQSLAPTTQNLLEIKNRESNMVQPLDPPTPSVVTNPILNGFQTQTNANINQRVNASGDTGGGNGGGLFGESIMQPLTNINTLNSFIGKPSNNQGYSNRTIRKIFGMKQRAFP